MPHQKKNMRLPRTLRALRVSAGLSQQKVADRLNISRSAYSYYELGTTEPDIFKIRSLAGLYGITMEDLLNGKIEQVRANSVLRYE